MCNGKLADIEKLAGVVRRSVCVALSTLVALSMNGCEEHLCTQKGCNYPLRLQVKAEHWVAGEYVVSITESGRTFECPFEKGADGAGGQAGSGQEQAGVVQCFPAGNSNAPELYFHEDVATITIMHVAKEVTVSVRRDGATLLDEKVTPTYAKSYPNGPDCSGECLNATETLTLPAEEG